MHHRGRVALHRVLAGDGDARVRDRVAETLAHVDQHGPGRSRGEGVSVPPGALGGGELGADAVLVQGHRVVGGCRLLAVAGEVRAVLAGVGGCHGTDGGQHRDVTAAGVGEAGRMGVAEPPDIAALQGLVVAALAEHLVRAELHHPERRGRLWLCQPVSAASRQLEAGSAVAAAGHPERVDVLAQAGWRAGRCRSGTRGGRHAGRARGRGSAEDGESRDGAGTAQQAPA